MHEHKPYRNANLKITELAQHIGLNRTYLSSFINSEYDMNFCSYINQLRYDEFQRLKSLEEYKNTTDAELAEIVGFGSYRSYTRFASLLNKDDRRSLC